MSGVPAELGPTRPDRLTIWPVKATCSVLTSAGAAPPGIAATVVARLLADAEVRGRLSQTVDGAWEVRVGPVPGGDVARLIDEFVW